MQLIFRVLISVIYLCIGCCCPTELDRGHQHDDLDSSTPLFERGGSCDYKGIWSYRRASALVASRPYTEVNVGDVSQQNWGNPSGNDLDNAYVTTSPIFSYARI